MAARVAEISRSLAEVVTFDQAETELIECWALLMRLPDREKGWLKSGSRCALPDTVRDRLTDYPDPEARPRVWLNRREMARVGRAFWDARCLIEAVGARDADLVGVVIAAKAGRLSGGFQWSDVWERMGRVLPVRQTGEGEHRAWQTERATSDAMRMRYERALGRVARRLQTLAREGEFG